MITVKDILKNYNDINKNKRLAFSFYTKSYTAEYLKISDSIINYAEVNYNSRKGLELIHSTKDNADTLQDLINIICKYNIDNDEELIIRDICNCDEIMMYLNDIILFI